MRSAKHKSPSSTPMTLRRLRVNSRKARNAVVTGDSTLRMIIVFFPFSETIVTIVLVSTAVPGLFDRGMDRVLFDTNFGQPRSERREESMMSLSSSRESSALADRMLGRLAHYDCYLWPRLR